MQPVSGQTWAHIFSVRTKNNPFTTRAREEWNKSDCVSSQMKQRSISAWCHHTHYETPIYRSEKVLSYPENSHEVKLRRALVSTERSVPGWLKHVALCSSAFFLMHWLQWHISFIHRPTVSHCITGLDREVDCCPDKNKFVNEFKTAVLLWNNMIECEWLTGQKSIFI